MGQRIDNNNYLPWFNNFISIAYTNSILPIASVKKRINITNMTNITKLLDYITTQLGSGNPMMFSCYNHNQPIKFLFMQPKKINSQSERFPWCNPHHLQGNLCSHKMWNTKGPVQTSNFSCAEPSISLGWPK